MLAAVALLSSLILSPGKPEISRAAATSSSSSHNLSKAPRLLNQAELITIDDYPLPAKFFEQEGSVEVVVTVDDDGKVADCIVDRSSGYPALDTQTCRLFWLRARFEPGRDETGRIAARVYRRTIIWRLEDRSLVPSSHWSSTLVWTLNRDGALISCKYETTGFSKASDQEGCKYIGELPAQARRFGFGPKSDRLTIMMKTQYAPNATMLPPHVPAGPNERVVSLQTSRVVLDAAGKVADCKPVEQGGMNALIGYDSCEELRKWRFESARNSKGAAVGGLFQLGTWVSD